MAARKLPAVVWKEGKWFVAKTINLEVASQGKTKKEALENLQEAVELLLEEEGLKISPTSIPQKVELAQIHA